MKKNAKRLVSLLAVAVIGSTGFLFGSSKPVDAGNFAQTVFNDDFSSATLNTQNWQANGANVGIADAGGALVIKTINTGYNNSITYKGYEFTPGENYTITFDASIKAEGDVWLGVVFGSDTYKGGTYEKNSDNGLVISAQKESTRVDNYAKGSIVMEDRFDFGAMTSNGAFCSFKLDLRAVSGAYELDFYTKSATETTYTKQRTLSIGGVDKYLAFQGNGENGTIKIKNLAIAKNGTPAVSENFETESETLICYSDEIADFGWVAQDERYTSGVTKVLKFDNAQDQRIVSKHAVTKDANNVNNFSFTTTFEWTSQTVGTGFGLELGIDNNGMGDKIYFEKTASGVSLVQKGANASAKSLATLDSLAGQATMKVVGRYDNSVDVYLAGEKIATAEDVDFLGNVAITSVGSTSAFVYESILVQNTYVTSTAPAIGDNFNTQKPGSATAGLLDTTKWVDNGNCSIRYRNGAGYLFFNAGDVNTSFNTKEKYQDFILRFDVTKIIGTYNRDTDDTHTAEGYYSDMSIGVSIGKKNYAESSISGDHASIQFCPKYMLKDEQGKLQSNMVIWGYGATMADGKTSQFPTENWWHDGSDGKDVTSDTTTPLSINVMIVASNGTVSVYYKYSNQDESYLETPKAVYVNVDTYGYAAISCGYNSSFWVDNLSITPLSFESYL